MQQANSIEYNCNNELQSLAFLGTLAHKLATDSMTKKIYSTFLYFGDSRLETSPKKIL